MLRTIHLQGEMRTRFGGPFRLHVATAVEAVRALGAQIPGFRRYILEHDFRVVRVTVPERAVDLTEAELLMGLGRATDLHLVPQIAGSGGGNGRNIAKIVGGVALAGVAWWAAGGLAGLGGTAFSLGGASVTYGNIAGFGLMLALSGASGMLTQTASKSKGKASIVFSGARNATEEGEVIPWVWGTRVRVGSVVISSGVSAEDIGLYD